MQILRGKKRRPRRTLFYSQHGGGKSTWAAGAPAPVFIQCEDGLDDIGVDRTELMTCIQDVEEVMEYLHKGNHYFKTVVIDTVDWYEKLVWAHIAARENVRSIEEIGFSKGYRYCIPIWEHLLKWLDCLRLKRNMNVILLAHAKIVHFNDPKSEGYDRYEPDLHKTVCPMMQEWCDEVFYGANITMTVKQDAGFGKDRTRAVDVNRRVVYTTEMPTHLAKRRVKMPDKIDMNWSAYQQHIDRAYSAIQDEGNISGIVKDGSSKAS